MVSERRRGRFEGYRVNCESVPCLPARVVADCVGDPRRIPYLLIWTRRPLPIERDSIARGLLAEPREAVRLAPTSFPDWVEIKRWDGTRVEVRALKRPLPHRHGVCLLLICNRCQKLRRALYCCEAIKHARYLHRSDWPCRQCAALSYASEGGAPIYRSRWGVTRLLSGLSLYSRAERWEPLVFTSPNRAADWGLAQNVYSDSELA
jgi:hypothetical protein